MASAFAEYDFVLDFAIAALVIVLAYLAWKRRVFEDARADRAAVAEKKKREFKSLREKAGEQAVELKEERKRINADVAEARKKYMKGDMDFSTFIHLQREYDAQLVDVDARLNALSEISGKSGRPSAFFKDLLSDGG
ncbi:MAG: hypothetical protein V1787_06530 [Candidatus Micrarchaeota archaeon]